MTSSMDLSSLMVPELKIIAYVFIGAATGVALSAMLAIGGALFPKASFLRNPSH
jgi:hypothetical protein